MKKKILLILLLVLLVIFGGKLGIRLWQESKLPGIPDLATEEDLTYYIERLSDDKDNRLLYYLEAIKLYHSPDKDISDALPDIQKGIWKIELAKVEEYIKRNDPALAKLEEGMSKEHYDSTKMEDRHPLSECLPHLQGVRHLARLLVLEGNLYEKQRRPKEAMESYVAAIKLGQDTTRHRSITRFLVSIVIQDYAYSVLRDKFQTETFEPEIHHFVLTQLKDLEKTEVPLSRTLEGEAEDIKRNADYILQLKNILAFFDSYEMYKTWLEEKFFAGTYAIAPPRFLMWSVFYTIINKEKVIENIELAYREAAELSKRPYPQMKDDLKTWKERTKKFDIYTQTNIPFALITIKKYTAAKMERQLTHLIIALEYYQAKNGAYPADLSQLTPEYISEIPLDCYTGTPFIYRKEGAGWILYGVGPDLKDDGGNPDGCAPGVAWWSTGPEGDIVFKRE